MRRFSALITADPEAASRQVLEVLERHGGILPDVASEFGCSLRVIYAWLKRLSLQDKALEIRQAHRAEIKASGKKIFEMRPRQPTPEPVATTPLEFFTEQQNASSGSKKPEGTTKRGRKAVV